MMKQTRMESSKAPNPEHTLLTLGPVRHSEHMCERGAGRVFPEEGTAHAWRLSNLEDSGGRTWREVSRRGRLGSNHTVP